MKPLKILFLLLSFLPSSLWALSFDWSGWTRMNSYYQWKDSYYGSFHFVLNSNLSITDNLRFKTRLDALPLLEGKSFVESYLLSSPIERS